MANIFIGLSALRTNQYGMDVISSNIANANTPGYHRQRVHLEQIAAGYLDSTETGTGVNVNFVERIRSQVTEFSLTNAISDTSNVDQLLTVERSLEAIFNTGDGSIHQSIDVFFGELTKLSSNPNDATQRTQVARNVNEIVERFRDLNTQLFELKSAVNYQLGREVELLNTNLSTLNEVTSDIRSNATSNTNAELDRRDALINEIALIIDVQRQEIFGDGLNLSIAGGQLQQGPSPIALQVLRQPGDQVAIAVEGSDAPLGSEGGRIAALVELYNTTIPEFQSRLDELAQGFIQELDSIHSKGIGPHGSFTSLNASRNVDGVNSPLASATTEFPIDDGELFISIVDASGERRTERLVIDPDTQSLSDVATQISAIDGLFASVNIQTGRLRIAGLDGVKFDFTGSLETTPDQSANTGTSIGRLSGAYTGDTNQELTYEIIGSGDVGVSDNLFVRVLDSSGNELTRADIGNGYEAGSEIELFSGINISFGPGTVVNGESFSSFAVNDSDTSGILVALGLNTIFSGNSASSIGVSDELSADSLRFASGFTGDSADTDNLFKFIEIQDVLTMSDGRQTFTEYLSEITVDIGARVQANEQLSLSVNSLQFRLEQERDSYSAVDLNEELVQLQQFQRSYEAAVEVIQAADDMINQLFDLVR